MRSTIATSLAAMMLTVPATAAAAPPAYKGKTDQGDKISVWMQKNGFVAVTTTVPASCVSAQGGNPVVLPTSFDPPYAFKVGRVAKVTVNGNPTKHYTVKTRRKGRRLIGKLAVNYSRIGAGDFGGFRILTCQGSANFDLRRR